MSYILSEADRLLGGEPTSNVIQEQKTNNSDSEETMEEARKFTKKGGIPKTPGEIAYDYIQSNKGGPKSIANGVVKYTRKFYDRNLTDSEIEDVTDLFTTFFGMSEDDAEYVVVKATTDNKE